MTADTSRVLSTDNSDRLVAMQGGRLYAHGQPEEVLEEDAIQAVFGLRSRVIRDPISGKPMMLPIGRHRLEEHYAN